MKGREVTGLIGNTKRTFSFKQCASYSVDGLRETIQALMEPFYDELHAIKHGDRVLLKPNLLSGHPPQDAVTTHPLFVEAVLQFFIDHGAKLLIGDSPSPVFKDIDKIFSVTGLFSLGKRYDIPLVHFDKSGWNKKEVDHRAYPIAGIIDRVDFVINLPKVKTHTLTALTLGVKNMYGVVPGFTKTLLHKEYPNAIDFSEITLDIYHLAKPLLTIYDGIIGMEGEGPAAGEPVSLGFAAATNDALATDIVLSHLLGLEKRKFPLYLAAMRRGYEPDKKLSFSGDALESFQKRNIRFPRTNQLNFIPPFLTKTIGTQVWARPRIITRKCTNCGKCVEACPASAIEKGVVRPLFNYARCINCFCCIEICPHRSVEIKVSPLVKIGMML
ncbi:MAG: DUF362 domain-containing protein [Candidatus Cloacimonadota bacterium]|nr:MAG: DUF362 domain-containing protein [Candidatus Cloacimonadota bacterium]